MTGTLFRFRMLHRPLRTGRPLALACGVSAALSVGCNCSSDGPRHDSDDGESHDSVFEESQSNATREAGTKHPGVQMEEAAGPYQPLALAYATKGEVGNDEAGVPGMCYTKTGGESNPCYVCHTGGDDPNAKDDEGLQLEYAFSDVALTNHWSNLFEDRSAVVAEISDEEILGYVREDNYSPLEAAILAQDPDFPGYVPDLDLKKGFDEEGFARDGSAWRAFRYTPFPGAFWPTNGSTDDVFIRLPPQFRETREHYKANLAIIEALIAGDPTLAPDEFRHPIEPIDETAIGVDLDADGKLEHEVTEIVGRPDSYVGNAAGKPLAWGRFPQHTEFLHTVRYLDPEAPDMIATRMKELRYMRKIKFLDDWAMAWMYEHEHEDKDRGKLPQYRGSADVGLIGALEWQLQGYIEDAYGRLRLQTDEEHRFCMGCHGGIGATVDATFSFARKQWGEKGWGYQTLSGMKDRPSAGHEKPEILTYFDRVKGGDELRANGELLQRFFDDTGKVKEQEVLRAAAGGDQDLGWLLSPSRERALMLDKAYRALVVRQRFDLGRDPTVTPVEQVHREIKNGATELAEANRYFTDFHLAYSHDGGRD